MAMTEPSVQALAFPKSHWTGHEAAQAAMRNGVRPVHLDETQGHWRAWLRWPEPGERFATVDRDLDGRPLTVITSRRLNRQADRPPADSPDLWTASERTRANLLAMHVAATREPDQMTDEDRRALAAYSGWGGLSIRKVADQFPEGFPAPHSRGLVHEYYTPTIVAQAVADMVRPLVPGLPSAQDGIIAALEPSAGIGRFVHALSGPGFEALSWTAIEWSDLSCRMLGALRPDIDLHCGPFERWVAERGAEAMGSFGLVVGNPPYGKRGAAVTEDPDRFYRERAAYAYFLRRSLDLLAPGGLGVQLVPGGFLTGASTEDLRRKILLRHHLSAAYRLPSGIFPGAMLVIDLVVTRARGGELAEVDADDRPILAGRYFEEFPAHILGEEVGKDAGDEEVTKKPRFGYQVLGEFHGLPPLVERPMCEACDIRGFTTARPAVRPRPAVLIDLPDDLEAALWLGGRVTTYGRSAPDRQALLHGDLLFALTAYEAAYGNPHLLAALRTSEDGRAAALLSAFAPGGGVAADLARRPTVEETVGAGAVIDVADRLYRSRHVLTVDALVRATGDRTAPAQIVVAGWCLDGHETLIPERDYYTGELWKRADRAQALAEAGGVPGVAHATVLARQHARLMEAIGPVTYEEIDDVDPRGGWIPVDILTAWVNQLGYMARGGRGPSLTLERKDGLLQVAGREYEEIGGDALPYEARMAIGWINHDRTMFRPYTPKGTDIDDHRLEAAAKFRKDFLAWLPQDEGRKAAIEQVYNRRFRGYVRPDYGAEPVDVARWDQSAVTPHRHQVEGARRLMAHRGGLLAYGTGVGKTYSAILAIAAARQEGWARRPVVLVPNTIAWKWRADILRALPDFRVAVIGSKLKTVGSGARKGELTSDLDTPEERSAKWKALQAGLYDVAILTYSALGRTRISEAAAERYAVKHTGIAREIRLRQRNAAGKSGDLTERQEAVLREGTAAWIAEKLEMPQGQGADPDVTWDEIGVDLLVVDEAQNFKNLYMPEPREHGVPRFMGNAGEGSKRAWQLDFRAGIVRERTGGSGVVLLSATPAKNSPLEFYNIIQYVDHDVWTRMGIGDPEQFIDRYLRLETRQVLDSMMSMGPRSAVVGFQNLHELRDVLFRYGDFKTSDDVGLKLPTATVSIVEVDMDEEQEAKTDGYIRAIEDVMASPDRESKGKILGYLARMSLVALHARLDEGYDWDTAGGVRFAMASPKIAAMAAHVASMPGCGHIVFCDNLAAHRWAVETLVARGVPRERIGVLNATTAKATQDRQRIADEFNGDLTAGIPPRYDVVVANQIAYEGIDLQRRTCAIHHLDLPWEPATLEQRNGRGVRQGNREAVIAIRYYFSRRSQDGGRFFLIQGKHGWMAQLLTSQDRVTNNPAAQADLGVEEILLLTSRDPEKTRAAIEMVKAKQRDEERARIRAEAARIARGAEALYRRAEAASSPDTRQRLYEEADGRADDLRSLDPQAWPWSMRLDRMRTEPMAVTDDGALLVDGDRIALRAKSAETEVAPVFWEIGKARGGRIGLRSPSAVLWRDVPVADLGSRAADYHEALPIEPSDLDPPGWPAEDAEAVERRLAGLDESHFWGGARLWLDLNLPWASDAFVRLAWEGRGHRMITHFGATIDRLPAVGRTGLLVQADVGDGLSPGLRPLSPTREGWQEFLTLAPASGMKYGELAELAMWWWGERVPKDLLSAPRDRRPAPPPPPEPDHGRAEPEPPGADEGPAAPADLLVGAKPTMGGSQLALFNPGRRRRSTHLARLGALGAPRPGEAGYRPPGGRDFARTLLDRAQALWQDPESGPWLEWTLVGLGHELRDWYPAEMFDGAPEPGDPVSLWDLADLVGTTGIVGEPEGDALLAGDVAALAARLADPMGGMMQWEAVEPLTRLLPRGRLRIVTVPADRAATYIALHHSALPYLPQNPVVVIGVQEPDTGGLVAVAVATTPSGRWGEERTDPRNITEIARIASDGSTKNAASMLAARIIRLGPDLARGDPSRPWLVVTYSLAGQAGTPYRALKDLGLRPVALVRGREPGGARAQAGDAALSTADKIRWEAGPAALPARWDLVAQVAQAASSLRANPGGIDDWPAEALIAAANRLRLRPLAPNPRPRARGAQLTLLDRHEHAVGEILAQYAAEDVLAAARRVARPVPGEVLDTSFAAYSYGLRRWPDMQLGSHETFNVVALDSRLRVLGDWTAAIGTIASCVVDPANVVRPVLERGWPAKTVIVYHGHPSGDPTPSEADKHLTAKLREVVAMFNVTLGDHIVVGDARYVSFADDDLLKGW